MLGNIEKPLEMTTKVGKTLRLLNNIRKALEDIEKLWEDIRQHQRKQWGTSGNNTKKPLDNVEKTPSNVGEDSNA
jgi:hypothetical protein